MIKKAIFLNMGVEPKIVGKPPKWMVYFMENPMNKWMIWGAHPYFWKHPYARMFSPPTTSFTKKLTSMGSEKCPQQETTCLLIRVGELHSLKLTFCTLKTGGKLFFLGGQTAYFCGGKSCSFQGRYMTCSKSTRCFILCFPFFLLVGDLLAA